MRHEEGDKLELPKWLLPALGTAAVSAATAFVNVYIDVAVLKQDNTVKDRMIYELRHEVAEIKQGDHQFRSEVLEILRGRHR